MNKQTKTLTWVLIIVIVLIVVGFLYMQTTPKTKPVSDVVVVDSDILDDPNAEAIESRTGYNNIPVRVSGDEVGRSDPFAAY